MSSELSATRPRWRTVHPVAPATREPAPPAPEGALAMEKIPGIDPPQPVPLIRILLPVVMVAAMLAMVFVMVRMAGTIHPMFLILPVMMAMSMMSMFGAPAGRNEDETRRVFLRHLAELRAAGLRNGQVQRRFEEYLNPAPENLWAIVAGPRLWERRAEDPDALHVRLGVGPTRLATPVETPEVGAPEDLDPVCAVAARHTVRSIETVEELPVVVNLAAFSVVSLAGTDARATARALVCQLAFHRLEVAEGATDWEWLKWLPHSRDPQAAAFRILVVDNVPTTGTEACLTGDDYTCVLEVGDGAPTALRTLAQDEGLALTVGAELHAHTSGGPEKLGTPDFVSAAQAGHLARAIAACRRPGVARGAAAGDLLDLLGLKGLTHPGAFELWRQPPRPVFLDLRESAHGGMGPHGLCIGATGSGKSELLRTLVAALAATHSPDDLNFVLVDFKGGATFLGLDRLPHTSAMITNLAEEAVLVERMHDAISGELNRRQEMLRAAGGVPNVTEYRQLRAQRPELEAMPALVIIVDEFSELLANHHDFADLFVAVGRLGRSLGVHLLLASQRLEEGRMRGLDSHLSYRIGLRTFSAAESRQVLGVTDAHELPQKPGAGFLKSGPGTPVGFQAAYVSGPVRDGFDHAAEAKASARGVRFFNGWHEEAALGDSRADTAGAETNAGTGDASAGPPAAVPTVVEAITTAARQEAAHRGMKARQIWLPPLPRQTQLAGVATARGFLAAGCGLIDRPYEGRQDPLVIDFSSGDGHLALAGGPKTGKSTALRTMVTSLAATHTTSQVRFYVIDSGRELASLERLPHVAGRAGRGESERAGRVLDEVLTFIDDHPGGTPAVQTFLILDGWHNLAADLEDRLDDVARIAADGPAAGVHVLISTARWTALRPAVRDLISRRFELRLAETLDSLIGRKAPGETPRSPGKGHHAGQRAGAVGAGEQPRYRPRGHRGGKAGAAAGTKAQGTAGADRARPARRAIFCGSGAGRGRQTVIGRWRASVGAGDLELLRAGPPGDCGGTGKREVDHCAHRCRGHRPAGPPRRKDGDDRSPTCPPRSGAGGDAGHLCGHDRLRTRGAVQHGGHLEATIAGAGGDASPTFGSRLVIGSRDLRVG
ncbi:type VII secretion protein EccC [Corynebacterium atypicum]|nr:FtsK/SpoIIIE domain-containing protein [Corynebacterium atypicum]